MFDATNYALVATASLTALLHTLIPDHWLPFVLVGRSQSWSLRRTATASGLAALIHVGLSLLLGLGAVVIGLKSAELLGETLERAGAALLIVFGLGYAAWAWHNRGHFHPGGALLHRQDTEAACDGHEGPRHPEHLHFHADGQLIRDRDRLGMLALALIVGANPCVLILPTMVLAATSRGPSAGSGGTEAVGLVVLAYAIPTAALMVGLSVLGVSGTRRIRLPGAARHMELASGLMVALLGLTVLLLDLG